MRRTAAVAALASAVWAAAIAAQPPPDAERAAALVEQLAAAAAAVSDYRVILTKRQRIRGEMQSEDTIRLKHRRSPECRYLGWTAGPNKGRELLHCVGRNDNKMQVHEGGLLGLITISLDPFGDRARRDDLRPITETGIYSIVAFARADRDLQQQAGDTRVTLGARTVHDQPSTCIAAPGGTSSTNAYTQGRREVCIHDELRLPTEVRGWDTEGRLMEHYTFREYVLNPGLTDADFDPENPDYDF